MDILKVWTIILLVSIQPVKGTIGNSYLDEEPGLADSFPDNDVYTSYSKGLSEGHGSGEVKYTGNSYEAEIDCDKPRPLKSHDSQDEESSDEIESSSQGTDNIFPDTVNSQAGLVIELAESLTGKMSLGFERLSRGFDLVREYLWALGPDLQHRFWASLRMTKSTIDDVELWAEESITAGLHGGFRLAGSGILGTVDFIFNQTKTGSSEDPDSSTVIEPVDDVSAPIEETEETEELEQLRQAIKEATEDVEATKAELVQKLQEVQREQEDLKKQKEVLEREADAIKQARGETEVKRAEIADTQHKIDQEQQDLDKQKQDLDQLQQNIAEEKDATKQLEKEAEVKRAEIAQRQEKVEQEQKDLNNKKQYLDQLQNNIAQEKDATEQLEEEAKEAEEAIKETKREMEVKRAEIAQQQQNVQQEQQDLDKQEQDLDKQEEDLNKLQQKAKEAKALADDQKHSAETDMKSAERDMTEAENLKNEAKLKQEAADKDIQSARKEMEEAEARIVAAEEAKRKAEIVKEAAEKAEKAAEVEKKKANGATDDNGNGSTEQPSLLHRVLYDPWLQVIYVVVIIGIICSVPAKHLYKTANRDTQVNRQDLEAARGKNSLVGPSYTPLVTPRKAQGTHAVPAPQTLDQSNQAKVFTDRKSQTLRLEFAHKATEYDSCETANQASQCENSPSKHTQSELPRTSGKMVQSLAPQTLDQSNQAKVFTDRKSQTLRLEFAHKATEYDSCETANQASQCENSPSKHTQSELLRTSDKMVQSLAPKKNLNHQGTQATQELPEVSSQNEKLQQMDQSSQLGPVDTKHKGTQLFYCTTTGSQSEDIATRNRGTQLLYSITTGSQSEDIDTQDRGTQRAYPSPRRPQCKSVGVETKRVETADKCCGTDDKPKPKPSPQPLPEPIPEPIPPPRPPSDQNGRRGRNIGYLPTADRDSNGVGLFHKIVAFLAHFNRYNISIEPLTDRRQTPAFLPCVGASRLGSDVAAAFAKSKLPNGCVPLLILIHPRAPHNDKVFPTRQKGSDFLKEVDDVFDFVVWEDRIYDCKQNHTAARELVDFLKRQQRHYP